MMSYKECQKRYEIGYIYKIINLINNKIYIGCSVNPELRFRKHKESAISGGNCLIHRAMRKYGIENFIFEIIDTIPLRDMYNKEKYWISYYNSMSEGYNMTSGGEGGNTYASKSDEELKSIKEKVSEGLRRNNGNKGQYKKDKNPMYKVIPYNKFLYLLNINTNKGEWIKANKVKEKFNIDKYKTLTNIVRQRQIINGYLIIESVSTDGDECSHVG